MLRATTRAALSAITHWERFSTRRLSRWSLPISMRAGLSVIARTVVWVETRFSMVAPLRRRVITRAVWSAATRIYLRICLTELVELSDIKRMLARRPRMSREITVSAVSSGGTRASLQARRARRLSLRHTPKRRVCAQAVSSAKTPR